MSQPHINSPFRTNSFGSVADEKSRILAWLSPLEPRIRHQEIRTRRVSKVGDWLLQTKEYQNWFESSNGGESDGLALFCYGSLGAGKTYISSLVVDALYGQAVGEDTTVACFYLDSAAQKEQSPAAILGSVLKQIVDGLDEVPERITKAFRNKGKTSGGQRLALGEIVEFLQDISSSRRTFICIDALDECPPGHRVKLLDSLNEILQETPGARLFLTGRPNIRAEVEKHLARRIATRSIMPTKDDITIFLRAKLGEDTMPEAMNASLEEEIIQNIPDIFSEIFLLASLSIETILQEMTLHRRREKLSAIRDNSDLGDAYKATLGRIKAQGGGKAKLGLAVLMWITHSKRPLGVDEIRHAIAIQIGSNGLDSDDAPAISTLLGCCEGLVTIDEGTSTIRLIHSTIRKYLCTDPDILDRAHSTMAETCLMYLNSQNIKDLAADSPPDHRSTPFLEYSSLYWGIHMRMEFSDGAKTSALELLKQFDSHISAKVLWNSIMGEFAIDNTPDRKPFSALHCISYLGIAEVANALLEMKRWDVNQRDSVGVTPLIWGARCGHEKIVELLLQEKNIQPDRHDTNDGRTALSWAAGNGHERVVRLFLGPQFVNPGSVARRWKRETPRVMGLLFGKRYVNSDSLSKDGRTPLSWAAENGHEGIVKLLLEREDVDRTTPSKNGKTPLALATEKGHDKVVELLQA